MIRLDRDQKAPLTGRRGQPGLEFANVAEKGA
jgi:hypothetical protein